MKKVIAGAVAGAVVVGGIWFFTGATNGGTGDTLATIGSEKITTEQFHAYLEKSPQAKQSLLKLIENQVVLNQAKEQKFEVTDQEIEDELNNFIKERFNNDRAQLDTALKEYNLSIDDLKTDIKVTLLSQKMASKDVTVTDQEISDYYEKNKETLGTAEQVHARHILIKDEKVANEVMAKVKANPAEFEALAKQYSEDPSNKDKGGDLDYFGKGTMVKEFEDAAFAAKKDELVGPVKTDFGYHIIQVLDHKDAVIPKLEEVKDKIKKTLTEQKSKPLQDLVTELKAKEKIEITDEKYKDILTPPAAATPTGEVPAPETPASTEQPASTETPAATEQPKQ